MPPAIPIRAPEPRTLSTVLHDLTHARRDYDDALADMRNGVDWFDAEDRANEADQRLENLREEFAERLLAATGLSVEAIMLARQECVL